MFNPTFNRRTLLYGTGLGLAAAALHNKFAAAVDSRPNVLLIITDDQTRRMLAKMPLTQERVVRNGVRFTNGFAAVPFCGPSRTSLLTSLYPHNHRIKDNTTLPPFIAKGFDQDTISTRMKTAGYTNGYFGKFLNAYESVNGGRYVAPGWNRWVVPVQDDAGTYAGTYNIDGSLVSGGSIADKFAANKCVQFVFKHADRPWLAVFAPLAPHDPYNPSAGHEHDFDGASWNPPALNEQNMSDKPSWMRDNPPRNEANMRQIWEGKLEELQDTDDQIASIIRALWETGQKGRTWVFFVSDNGYLLGEHRLFRKEHPYEESAGIPFAVKGPGVAPAVEKAAFVSLVDLMPTILDIAGGDFTTGRALEGRSMKSHLLSGDWTGWRNRMLVENINLGWSMLCEGNTRYIEQAGNTEREFYNLAIDPYQMRSLHESTDTTEQHERLAALASAQGAEFLTLENS